VTDRVIKTADAQIESLTAVPPEERVETAVERESNRVPLLVIQNLR
jgi:hypothetical protein